MSFLDDVNLDMQTVVFNPDELGELASYLVKATSASVSTVVIFSRNESLSSWDSGGQAEYAQALIKKSDVAKPARYDTLTISGETWTVESTMESNAHAHIVRLSRDQRIS